MEKLTSTKEVCSEHYSALTACLEARRELIDRQSTERPPTNATLAEKLEWQAKQKAERAPLDNAINLLME